MEMKKRWTALGLALAALLALGAAGLAGSGYGIGRWVVAGGGGTTGGPPESVYQVSGAAGQPAAGPVSGVSSRYSLISGYWAGPVPEAAGGKVYLPLVVRGGP